MKDEDIVPAVAEHFQAAEERLAIGEQIGDEDDHAPAADGLGDAAHDFLDVGLRLRPADVQPLDERVDMRLLAARRHGLPHLVVKGNQADRILLPQQQVAQVLVKRAAAVVHRFAHVHDQRAAQVGFFLVLLDVVAVGLGPHLPVEVAEIVARDILPMLNKLDRVAEERALVHTGDEPLDHVPGTQIEPRDAGDGFGMQKSTGVFFFDGHS